MSSICRSDSVRCAFISVRTTTEPQPSTPSPTASVRNCSAGSDWKTSSSPPLSDSTLFGAPDESDRRQSFTLKLPDVTFEGHYVHTYWCASKSWNVTKRAPGLISHMAPRWQSNNMMATAGRSAQDESGREIFLFGPFYVDASQRQIERDGSPLQLSGRAFDILLALVRQAGNVV